MTTQTEQALPQERHTAKFESMRVADYNDGWNAALAAIKEALAAPAPLSINVQTMVNRFLGWKLPRDFAPDGGIRFSMKGRYEGFPLPECWPIGTNLLTADQAKAMFEYCLEGHPAPAPLTYSDGVSACLAILNKMHKVAKDRHNYYGHAALEIERHVRGEK